jgi:hypothetical protein
VAERSGGGDLGGSEAAECREAVRPEEDRGRERLGDPKLGVVRGRVLLLRRRRRAVAGAVGVEEAVEGVARRQPQPEEGMQVEGGTHRTNPWRRRTSGRGGGGGGAAAVMDSRRWDEEGEA